MRRLLLLALLLVFPLAAHAEKVMEVQNIRITESPSREAAVAQATQQAAAQVWQQLGRTEPLPDLPPARLQEIASYVDITGESVQANYYAATFNIGIRVGTLLGQTEPAPIDSATTALPVSDMPNWVLVVPAREVGTTITLWQADDAWAQGWQRAAGGQLATAVASGDNDDQKLLTAGQIQSFDPAVPDALRALARKYNAPAVALVVLSSSRPQVMPNEDIQVEISYIDGTGPDSLLSQTSATLATGNSASPFAAPLAQAQRLLASLASGQSEAPLPAVSANLPGAVPDPAMAPASFGNTFSGGAAPTGAEQKLWVRIPLTTPMDLGNYRKKIESIPGARFQITALNRMYVEGNILYSGDQAGLMRELSARGLAQQ